MLKRKDLSMEKYFRNLIEEELQCLNLQLDIDHHSLRLIKSNLIWKLCLLNISEKENIMYLA